MDESFSGEFSLDGIDVFVKMEIPTSVIKEILKPPTEPTVVAGRTPEIITDLAVRVELVNGSVFWTRGNRTWYKPKITFVQEIDRIPFTLPKCIQRGYHSVDPMTRRCRDCGRTSDEIHNAKEPIRDVKGIVQKGGAMINTNNELGKRLAENLDDRGGYS